MSKISPRTVEGCSSVKHPFSKNKLSVVDTFSALVSTPCSKQCSCERNVVMIVESDTATIKEYQVIECSSCKEQTWYVLAHAAI